MIKLTISFRGQTRDLEVEESMTIGSLLNDIENETQIPVDFIKLITAQVGMIKLDNLPDGQDTPVSVVFPTDISRKKIILMGTPINKIQELQETEAAKARDHARHLQRTQHLRRLARKPIRTTTSSLSTTASVAYTFHKIQPLLGLPNPEKSRELLERLRDDRGIRAIMEKYKWSVGVLSELDPASSTSHSSRLLGLNTGMGQMIQLRIRTDDYQGFCSYKEIRKVLCHELTHNIHSEHDRKFWDLCNILEKEVVDLDPFGHSGHQIGEDVYDGPGFGADTDELLMCDEGGWFGTTQKLGTKEGHGIKTVSDGGSTSKIATTVGEVAATPLIASSSLLTSAPSSSSSSNIPSSSSTSSSVVDSSSTEESNSVKDRIRQAAEERRQKQAPHEESPEAGR